MAVSAGVGGQQSDDIDPWLWFDAVDVDDWIEFILLSVASIGERLRRVIGEAGPGWLFGVVLPVEKIEENVGLTPGLGLTIGLGYGVKFRLLLVEFDEAGCPTDDVVPYDGVGLAVRRPLHDGDGERASPCDGSCFACVHKRNTVISVIQLFSCTNF